jgi:methylmalonyl-CoA mutase
MTKAIEGIPKLRIEAARKQARIDSGQDIIVGVNTDSKRRSLVILDVDNQMVRKQQLAQLDRIKASRDTEKSTLLQKLIDCAKTERKLTRNSRRRCKKPNYTRRNQRCLRNCLWKYTN